jgi:histidinol-phosphate/aromatic aminotransferase/cobyric acid decarboxylase-like protein
LKVISILKQPDIKALDIKDLSWYEIDDIQDLDIAESIFADDKTKLQKLQKRYGGYWRYPHILDFCYLINPYFPNEKLLSEIKANFERLITEYPSGLQVNNLLAAKYFWLKPDYVCVGNGAAELIKSLMNSVKGKIGIIQPTFEEYPNRLEKEQIIAYTVQNNDYRYSANDIITYFDDKEISNLVLINPDNPSGNLIKKNGVLEILEWATQKNIQLILDESFIDFAENTEENTLLKNEILEQYKNLVIVKSISESYGVPGLRLGIIATADNNLLSAVKKDVSIWNINSFAEFYLQIFGKYENDYKNACQPFVAERERFETELQKIPFLRVIPSQANYFLCEVTGKKNAFVLTNELLSKDILIKDLSKKYGFEGKEFVRIAVRDTTDNDLLIRTLKEL